MIQEEQRESFLTHDRALVHTAFSFYSHQKSRIKYFPFKKKKKNWEPSSLLECPSRRQCGGIEATSFRFRYAVHSCSVQGRLHRIFCLGLKSYVDSFCHFDQFLLWLWYIMALYKILLIKGYHCFLKSMKHHLSAPITFFCRGQKLFCFTDFNMLTLKN